MLYVYFRNVTTTGGKIMQDIPDLLQATTQICVHLPNSDETGNTQYTSLEQWVVSPEGVAAFNLFALIDGTISLAYCRSHAMLGAEAIRTLTVDQKGFKRLSFLDGPEVSWGEDDVRIEYILVNQASSETSNIKGTGISDRMLIDQIREGTVKLCEKVWIENNPDDLLNLQPKNKS